MLHGSSHSGSCKQPRFHTVALVSEALPRSHMLIRSARYHGYELHLLVLNNQERNNFVSSRVHSMLKFLKVQCKRSVVMFVDAYDVFFLNPARVALGRTLGILYSE